MSEAKKPETTDAENVDDPDLEAAFDESEREHGEPADEVLADMKGMIRAIGKAVA